MQSYLIVDGSFLRKIQKTSNVVVTDKSKLISFLENQTSSEFQQKFYFDALSNLDDQSTIVDQWPGAEVQCFSMRDKTIVIDNIEHQIKVKQGVDVAVATKILECSLKEGCEQIVLLAGDSAYEAPIKLAKSLKNTRFWVAGLKHLISDTIKENSEGVIDLSKNWTEIAATPIEGEGDASESEETALVPRSVDPSPVPSRRNSVVEEEQVQEPEQEQPTAAEAEVGDAKEPALEPLLKPVSSTPAGPQKFPYTCADCGEKGTRNRPTNPKKPFYCIKCMKNHQPEPERLPPPTLRLGDFMTSTTPAPAHQKKPERHQPQQPARGKQTAPAGRGRGGQGKKGGVDLIAKIKYGNWFMDGY